MHHREPPPARRDGARPGQEGSLTHVSFVGSFPAADFRVDPALPEIAFIGRSNVGKSSLINALTGRRALARTSRTPGKTRLCNVFAVEGRYFLVDLPGYGYARAAQRERHRFHLLLSDYLLHRQPLIGVVWLLDVRHAPSADDLAMARLLEERRTPVLVAVTKADKLPWGQRRIQAGAILTALGLPEEQAVLTSAHTRDGVAELREAVESLVARGLTGVR